MAEVEGLLVRIEASTALLRQQLGQAEQRVDQATRRMDASLGTVDRAFERVAAALGKVQILLAGAGIAAGLTDTAKAARDFETAVAQVSTLLKDTSGLARYATQLKDLAKQFGGLPVDQAKGLYEVLSAGGYSAANAMEVLTASNKLAIGGVTDIQTAADGLTSTLNAYGAAAGSAADVADAFFTSAAAGKTSIADLAAYIGQVSPIAAQTGVTLDQLLAAVAALTAGGIKTSTAMDGMRNVIQQVLKPSDEAAKLAKALGLQFNAAALSSKGLSGFLADVSQKTGGSSEMMARLFGGVEALLPVMALTGTGAKDFAGALADMATKAGATDAAFAKIAATSEQAMKRLNAQVVVYQTEVGEKLLAVTTPVVQALSDHFDTATKAVEGLALGLSVTLAARAIPVAITALGSLNAALLSNALTALPAVLALAAGALYTFRDDLRPVADGMATLGDYGRAAWAMIKEAIDTAGAALDTVTLRMDGLGPAAELAGDTVLGALDALNGAIRVLMTSVKAWGNLFINTFVALYRLPGELGTKIVTAFREAFSAASNLASAFWTGLQATFAGDFSFGAFNSLLERDLLAPFKGTVGEISADLGAIFSTDRIGGAMDTAGAAVVRFGQTWKRTAEGIRGQRMGDGDQPPPASAPTTPAVPTPTSKPPVLPSGADLGKLAEWRAEVLATVAANDRLAAAYAGGAAAVEQATRQQEIEQQVLKLGAGARADITRLVNAEADSRRRLDLAKFTAQMDREIDAARLLADATAKGTAAVEEANVQAKVAVELAQRNIAAGTDEARVIEDKVRALESEGKRRRENEALRSAEDDLEVSRAELALMHESEPVRARALATLRAQNQAMREFGTVTEGAGQRWFELQQQIADVEALKTFNNEVKQTSENIAGDLAEKMFEKGGSIMDWWRNLLKRMAIEIASTQFIMPIVQTVVGGAPGLFGIQAPAGAGKAGGTGQTAGAGGAGGLTDLIGLGNLFSGGGSGLMQSVVSGVSEITFNVTGSAGLAQGLGLGIQAAPWGILGSMGANLLGLGGKGGIGGMVGGTVGSIAGGAVGASSLGAMLGAAGGPVGAVVGAFLGTALGGLFGPGKATPYGGAWVNRDANGNVLGRAEGAENGVESAPLAEAAEAISTAVFTMAKAGGLSTPGAWIGFENHDGNFRTKLKGWDGPTVSNSQDPNVIAADVLKALVKAGDATTDDPIVAKALANLKADTAEAMANVLQLARGISDATTGLADLDASLAGVTRQAREAAAAQFDANKESLSLADANGLGAEFRALLVAQLRASFAPTQLYTAYEVQMAQLEGQTQATLQAIQELNLGISATEVAAAKAAKVTQAVTALNASLDQQQNEASGRSYINQINTAWEALKTNARDLAALGQSTDKAHGLFRSLTRNILADLDPAQLADVAATFATLIPELSGMAAAARDVALASSDAGRALTENVADTLERLSDTSTNFASTAARSARQLAESLRSAASDLVKANSNLLIGDLSPLSAGDKLAEARRQHMATLQLALQGNAAAMAELPELGEALLRLSDQVNAHGADYMADVERVVAARKMAAEAAGAHADLQEDAADKMDVVARQFAKAMELFHAAVADGVITETERAAIIATFAQISASTSLFSADVAAAAQTGMAALLAAISDGFLDSSDLPGLASAFGDLSDASTIAAAGLAQAEAALRSFLSGIAVPTPQASAAARYFAGNADVKAAYAKAGGDADEFAARHWVQFGAGEDRETGYAGTLSRELQYVARYADLRSWAQRYSSVAEIEAFAKQHWANFGAGEGRQYQLGGLVGYQAGGLIGNGRWNVDSVLARFAGGGAVALAGGEFVTRAPSVTAQTQPVLDFINRFGRLPALPAVTLPEPHPSAGPSVNDNGWREALAEFRALRGDFARVAAENTALRAEVSALRSSLDHYRTEQAGRDGQLIRTTRGQPAARGVR